MGARVGRDCWRRVFVNLRFDLTARKHRLSRRTNVPWFGRSKNALSLCAPHRSLVRGRVMRGADYSRCLLSAHQFGILVKLFVNEGG